MHKLIAITFGLFFSANSSAVLMSEVSENAYITIGNYDVAWASPCAAVSPSCAPIDLSYQSQFGWKVITEDLFNSLGLSATSFVFAGANVDYATGNNLDEATGATIANLAGQLPQGDVAVATPWFSSRYDHIDWGNGVDNKWSFADNNGLAYGDTIVARYVPEPSSISL
ncbi:hypothetical protein, partial [Photobacterium sanctipauli]